MMNASPQIYNALVKITDHNQTNWKLQAQYLRAIDKCLRVMISLHSYWGVIKIDDST
jgi:hypothetical protein